METTTVRNATTARRKLPRALKPWFPQSFPYAPSGTPVHTVAARWGSTPSIIQPWGIPWKGYRPDWHVLVIQHDPEDRCYPYWVEGWLHGRRGPEHFIWKCADFTDPRYDITAAVVLPLKASC